MSEIIQFSQKPIKTVETYEGKIQLDKEYTFMIYKSINGDLKYSVDVPDMETGVLRDLITNTVINYAEKHGIGKSV